MMKILVFFKKTESKKREVPSLISIKDRFLLVLAAQKFGVYLSNLEDS